MIQWTLGAVVQNAFPFIFTLGVIVSLLWLGLSRTNQTSVSRLPSRTSLPIIRIDAGLAALAVGLISARLGFVALHWEYYASKPIEVLWFWQGGLSWVGGALGAILGLGLFCILTRHPFWPLADTLALPGMVVALACWSGCLADGCAYGRALDSPLWASPTPDMFGSRNPRWPTQMIGVVYSSLALVLLYWLAGHHPKPGILACISLSMIAAGAFALSFTRSDPIMLLSGLRLDTWGSAAILLLGGASLTLCGLHHRRRSDGIPKPGE
ncbi:MAG: prolipoprotein diacylglyceryl transferase [Anaerolineaceae bacterium]|nr:MAG: prolipoprotein diacylglyceryl transferase [Anaerolineaceae bacterium]